jgi:hypothetical protein
MLGILCGGLTVGASASPSPHARSTGTSTQLALVPGSLLAVTGVVALALICCCACNTRLFALAPIFGAVCAIAAIGLTIGLGNHGLLCELDDTYSSSRTVKASCFSPRTSMCGVWPVVAVGNGTTAALQPISLPNTFVPVDGALALIVSVIVVVLVTAPPLYNVNANEQ